MGEGITERKYDGKKFNPNVMVAYMNNNSTERKVEVGVGFVLNRTERLICVEIRLNRTDR